MSHTKGPWKPSGDGCTIYGSGKIIASVYWPDMATPPIHNATLMAAAPELLDALKETYRWIIDGTRQPHGQRGAQCSTVYEVEDMIRAAIRKSEGRL